VALSHFQAILLNLLDLLFRGLEFALSLSFLFFSLVVIVATPYSLQLLVLFLNPLHELFSLEFFGLLEPLQGFLMVLDMLLKLLVADRFVLLRVFLEFGLVFPLLTDVLLLLLLLLLHEKWLGVLVIAVELLELLVLLPSALLVPFQFLHPSIITLLDLFLPFENCLLLLL